MNAILLKRLIHTLPIGITRRLFNLWSPFRGAGIKIESVSPDFHHIEVSMKFKWYNKNYVGTQFGGSIYAMTDPFYMFMLINILGDEYIVWDKAAFIDFKKPGRSKLRATFKFSIQEIQEIQQFADKNKKYIFDRLVEVFNDQGEIIATVTKTLYVRKKS